MVRSTGFRSGGRSGRHSSGECDCIPIRLYWACLGFFLIFVPGCAFWGGGVGLLTDFKPEKAYKKNFHAQYIV